MKLLSAVKKYGTVPIASGLVVVSSFPVFASDVSGGVVGPDAWEPIVSGMTAQVNVTTIVAVLASVIAAVMGLVFMWWGLRKVTRMIMAAFRGGKVTP